MRILVTGSGGREHALAWKLSQSPGVQVYAAPGNPGMARCGECIPAGDGSPRALLAVAESVKAELTVVGPEAPLGAGVVDAFLPAWGATVRPTAGNARRQDSRNCCKNVFRQFAVTTT